MPPPRHVLILAVDAPYTATVQEVHQVLVHLLCEAIDEQLAIGDDALLSEVER